MINDPKSGSALPAAAALQDEPRAAEALVLPPWQEAVRKAVRDPQELASLLGLTVEELGHAATPQFPLLVPRGFVARMRRRDPTDPLLRQVWPARPELDDAPGYGADPVGEQALATGGVLRKYAGRVLLIASGTCPLHCRYCFRRDFPYQDQLAARGDWSAAIAALADAPDAREAILSGGDPLSLSNRRLRELIGRLEATSITTLRIHTRFPVAVPERVDAGLVETLAATRLRAVVVVHANHANELDDEVADALDRLRGAVTALLNQSVLLAGVNDSVTALAALSERLFACGALPYYLHLLDRVTGARHFEVDEETARHLVAELRTRLPGYLVPKLVREIAGELSKTPLG